MQLICNDHFPQFLNCIKLGVHDKRQISRHSHHYGLYNIQIILLGKLHLIECQV